MARVDETKRQYWAKRIEEWETSGVSQRAYCQRAGHRFATFDYWRRQFRATKSTVLVEQNATPSTRLTLVPVRVAIQAKRDDLILRSPSGWQLTIPASMDKEWLTTFMRSLS